MTDDPNAPRVLLSVANEVEAASIVTALDARHQSDHDGQFHVGFPGRSPRRCQDRRAQAPTSIERGRLWKRFGRSGTTSIRWTMERNIPGRPRMWTDSGVSWR